MALPIDQEPLPRPDRASIGPSWPNGPVIHRFEDLPPIPKCDFEHVLGSRRSRTGEGLSIQNLGSILRCSQDRRDRRLDGRFGTWESRTAPSAGGIHGIRFVILPMESQNPAGLYEPDLSAIIELPHLQQARQHAARFLTEIDLPRRGWFLQLVADMHAYSSRYDNSDSLVLRDAGALSCATCFVAEAVGAYSRILGHLDKRIVKGLALGSRYAGVGGIHLTGT